ncbi:MAG: DNA alkylation repair protein [Streptosporangiaceae bacterium]
MANPLTNGDDPAAVAASWERTLRAAGTAGRAASEKAYLKSDLEFAGTGVPAIRAMVAAWCRARPRLAHHDVTGLVQALWGSPLYECRQAAVVLLERMARLLGPADMPLIEHLLRTSHTWALVDGIAVNVAGDLTERFGELGQVLDRWAADDDFWLRRSALLALLRPLRAGGGDFDRFARHADAMLAEREYFIRKAIGWVLREVGKRRPALVADWLGPRVHLASGVTVREAVKPLPAPIRAALMTGYRDKNPIRWEHLHQTKTG